MAIRPPHAEASAGVGGDPLVTELMSTRLVGITADVPLTTALRVMASSGVRHLPVLAGRHLLGMVVETDLVRCLALTPGTQILAAPTVVGEITRQVRPVTVSARRSDAAARMQDDGTDAVLVADRGRLVGIVTATDLIRSLAGPPPAAAGTGTTAAAGAFGGAAGPGDGGIGPAGAGDDRRHGGEASGAPQASLAATPAPGVPARRRVDR